MSDRKLFVFVEGGDDERFFNNALRPLLEKVYGFVHFWQYSQQTKAKVNRYLNSIRAMQAKDAVDLVIVADLDASPCVTDRKKRLQDSFRSLSIEHRESSSIRSTTRVLIVCREIESWYLAGIGDDEGKRLGLVSTVDNSDHISKEQFLSLMPDRFAAKAEFMQEILMMFDHETARAKNSSFNYFMQNYGIEES